MNSRTSFFTVFFCHTCRVFAGVSTRVFALCVGVVLIWHLHSTNNAIAQEQRSGVKVRLPESISGHQPTILPLLTSDGKRLYFDRKHHPDNTGGTNDFDEIWFAERTTNSSWGTPQNLGKPLNTMSSDVLCSLSPDGRMALVYGVYDKELPVKTPGFSLSFSQNDGQWLFPVPIRIDNFYNHTKKYYARLASDNRTLLLALQRDNSLGGLDLYVSFRKDTALYWTEPLHLGATLNTAMYEGSPHLAADGKTLYFSSEGLGGMGVADLFVTRRLDDTWQRWTVPINLGTAINSVDEDSSIDVLIDGTGAYFVSGDSTGKKGLYYAQLPDSLRPTEAVLLSGKIKAENKLQSLPATDAEITITAYTLSTSANGILAPSLVSLAKAAFPSAEYALSLPGNASYFVRAVQPQSGLSALFAVNTFTQNRFERRTQDIVLSKGALPIALPPVYFEQGQAEITPEHYGALAAVLLEYKPTMRVELTGHTCDVGSEKDNTELSLKRAEAVAKLLESCGIARNRIVLIGKGKRQPVVRSTSEAARKQNRRVEILLRTNTPSSLGSHNADECTKTHAASTF